MYKPLKTEIYSQLPPFQVGKWNIGIARVPIEEFFKRKGQVTIEWFKPNEINGNFNADPFGLYVNGNYYFFFEEYDFQDSKGRISVIMSSRDDSRSLTNYISRTALELPTHLSYPYIFTYENKIYMIPENSLSNDISLYEATDLPAKWEKVRTLISDFPGLDNTLVQFNGLWWLFCTARGKNSNDELYIWYSNHFLEEWKPHKLNPVKRDSQSARPGGTPFVVEGRLYRPAQNSSERYGKQLVINEIVQLSPDTFEEKIVLHVAGYEPFGGGIHTLSCCGDITLIDGCEWKSSINLLYPYLKKSLKKIIKLKYLK